MAAVGAILLALGIPSDATLVTLPIDEEDIAASSGRGLFLRMVMSAPTYSLGQQIAGAVWLVNAGENTVTLVPPDQLWFRVYDASGQKVNGWQAWADCWCRWEIAPRSKLVLQPLNWDQRRYVLDPSRGNFLSWLPPAPGTYDLVFETNAPTLSEVRARIEIVGWQIGGIPQSIQVRLDGAWATYVMGVLPPVAGVAVYFVRRRARSDRRHDESTHYKS